MFKRIAQAYEILSDDKRRADYDKFGVRTPGAAGTGQHSSNTGHRRRTTAFHTAAGPTFPGFRSPFDIFREFFGDPFGDPFRAPFFAFFDANDLAAARRRQYTNNLFGDGYHYYSFDYGGPEKDENNCEFSSVIRFSNSTKDPGNKLKKTTTCTRLVDGKRIVTKKTEDDGEETMEILENGIIKSRLINGIPAEIAV